MEVQPLDSGIYTHLPPPKRIRTTSPERLPTNDASPTITHQRDDRRIRFAETLERAIIKIPKIHYDAHLWYSHADEHRAERETRH